MPIIPSYEDGTGAERDRVAELIRFRRPGRRLINLDCMLLLGPPPEAEAIIRLQLSRMVVPP